MPTKQKPLLRDLAPRGYYARESHRGCRGCVFEKAFAACGTERCCCPCEREDKRSVIFVKRPAAAMSKTARIRRAVADYMYSEGCSCCRDVEGHKKHAAALAKLLGVSMYKDKSGWNFAKFRTGTGKVTAPAVNQPKEELKELAAYLKGMADALENEKMARASDWLKKLSHYVCGQGYIGCPGGPNCGSDHK